MPAFHPGKTQGFIGQHGKEPVIILGGSNRRKVRGDLHHEMRFIGAVRRGQIFQAVHNTPGLGFNPAVMQSGDVDFEIAGDGPPPAVLLRP